MNDFQIIATFLQKYSAEILIISILTCITTQSVKKFIPYKLNNLVGYLPFLIGAIYYAGYCLIFSVPIDFCTALTKGVQSGGVATLIYVFFKHITSSKFNAKKAVADLLKGIVSSKTVSNVAELIANTFSKDVSDEELLTSVTEILQNNTEIDGDVLTVVAKLIKQTLTDNK